MSPEETRAAAVARYRQAKDALKSGDAPRAVTLFEQALELTPASAQVRRALRDAQCQAIPPNPELPKLTKLKLMKLKAQMKVMDAAGDWAGLLKTAEEAASIDPWDVETNAMTAAACLGLDYKATAFVFYQRVAEQDPENTKYLRRCASLLEINQQDEKAFEYWERIHKVDPNDALAGKRVKEGRALGLGSPASGDAGTRPAGKATSNPLDSDTILDEGDTSHGEQQIPSRDMAEIAADSGLDPDSSLSGTPQNTASADEPQAGPDGPPPSRIGPSGPPAAPAGAGPAEPPTQAGPSGPPRRTRPASPLSSPVAAASGQGPAGAGPDGPPASGPPGAGPAAAPPGPGPAVVPADGAPGAGPDGPPAAGPAGPPGAGPAVAPAGSGPAIAPSAGPSSSPRFSEGDLLPGGGPSSPPAAASGPPPAQPPRRAQERTKAFPVPIPDDMPDHVHNLLTVASSLLARDRATEACTVLEKALTITEGDEWIEGMLLALKRRPR